MQILEKMNHCEIYFNIVIVSTVYYYYRVYHLMSILVNVEVRLSLLLLQCHLLLLRHHSTFQ